MSFYHLNLSQSHPSYYLTLSLFQLLTIQFSLTTTTCHHLILFTISTSHYFNLSLFNPLTITTLHYFILLTISIFQLITMSPFHYQPFTISSFSLSHLVIISTSHYFILSPPFHLLIFLTISLSNYFTFSPLHLFTIQSFTNSSFLLSHPHYFNFSLFHPLTNSPFYHLIFLTISIFQLFTILLSHNLTLSPVHLSHHLIPFTIST